MRRGAKPGKAKVVTKRPRPRTSPKDEASKRHDLEKRLAESLEREKAKDRALTEALEQQTATAAVLRVISSSPTDIQPVLSAVAESAARLCHAYDVTVFRLEGDVLRLVAHHGPVPATPQLTLPVTRDTVGGRTVVEARTIQVADVQLDDGEFPLAVPFARQFGHRTLLSVPLMRESVPIGVIQLRRTEVAPFNDAQIALLKAFADQAVIAIENVRLFTELQEKNQALTEAHAQISEALEQQTATSEILRVIASSPTDLQPVLDALAESASRLCRSVDCNIFLPDGDRLVLRARYGPSRGEADVVGQFVLALVRGSVAGRTVLERRTVHVIDLLAEADEFPEAHQNARRFGFRTMLSVPLIRESAALGVIQLLRTEVNPFTDRQAELLKTFADQAVIAIENVRLFTELQASNRELTTALDTQTATSDILSVISQSQTDVQPVFEAIVASAVRLLGAYAGGLTRIAGDQIVLAALTSTDAAGDAAVRATFPQSLGGESLPAQVIRDRAPVNIADAQTDPRVSEVARVFALARGYRSLVMVPLLRHDEAVGTIAVSRRESGGFTDDEIALLKTFADQAVIAIENVRLFNELEGRNRDLTATSEILRVISQSPTDVQPVFDTIVRSAVRLCDGLFSALHQFDGELLHLVAHHNYSPEALEEVRRLYPARPSRGQGFGRAILERELVHIPDVEVDPEYQAQALSRAIGFRSGLFVPMLREGVPIGAIMVARAKPGPFSDNEIELLQTFADQAVIAVENVRLFTELEGRNRDLTATSEILRVISSSPTDVQPVFDTIVRSAMTLCDGLFSALFQFDGERLHHVAQHNVPPEGLEELRRIFPTRPTRGLQSSRAILERAVVHVPDVELDPEFQHLALSRAVGFRSGLWVPMLRDGVPIGVIAVNRAEPGPFSENQIELLKTFADQAVIAIENVRLFKELQASNRELTSSLDTQTATSDILRAISRSQTNVQPVFDAIVASAMRLLGGYTGGLTRVVGDQIELAALTSTDAAGDASLRGLYPRPLHSQGAHGQAIRDRAPVNILDMHTDLRVTEAGRNAARIAGYQSVVTVPLLRHDEAIGALGVTRPEPGGFTDDEIAVLQTFADQAVIAIENARLLSELQQRNEALTQAHAQVSEALEQQTATAEILRVISRSPTDVQPVFDAIVRSASQLCDGADCIAVRFDGELMHLMARHNPKPGTLESVAALFPRRPSRDGTATDRAILEGHMVHVPDVLEDPTYDQRRVRAAQLRSLLSVPLMRAGNVIGAISPSRAVPGLFSDRQVELLKTFADQAVIAIENVRLFKELEARTAELTHSVEQLTALGEVGRAVSSTLDLETVLTTIVSRAVELSRLDSGVVFEYEEATEEFVHRAATETGGALAEARRATRVQKGEGVVGRTAITLEPVQVPDITMPGAHESRLRENLIESGVRAILAVPMVREGRLIGSLVVSRNQPGDFPTEAIELLRTFATQSALAIQNARLFHEIADKSRQLEAASRHKSEFLANMSHELRTPLNAIIGFSEVLVDRMFGELTEKQDEYLKDIYASGQHLLSLINDILDLSKIEAGRMELEVTDFDLPSAIDNALILVRERATRRGITLGHSVDERLGSIRGDERKVKQVLLNLLSNALKFTPEGGRIDVSARAHDGVAEVSVADTGVGIAPEDQEAVFEEFRQVGTADKKVEGTGLGLALSRKFIELHGGRIWVTSQLGAGSTFTFSLPLRS